MKPFDLKAALSGELLEYKGDILRVSELSMLGDERVLDCSVVGTAKTVRGGGMYIRLDGTVPSFDGEVTMAPRKVKKTVFVMIGKERCGIISSMWFDSQDEAAQFRGFEKVVSPIVPVEIEVEE